MGFHIGSWGGAFILAFASWNYFTFSGPICLFNTYPLGQNLAPHFLLFLLPVLLSIVLICTFNIQIFLAVRKTEKDARKWRMECRSVSTRTGLSTRCSLSVSTPPSAPPPRPYESSLDRKVFWQSFSWLCAFLIPWPILLASSTYGLIPHSEVAPLPFWLVSLGYILGPLQGFFNALVYFRPRIARALSCRHGRGQQQRRRRRRRGEDPSVAIVADDKLPSTRFERQLHQLESADGDDRETSCTLVAVPPTPEDVFSEIGDHTIPLSSSSSSSQEDPSVAIAKECNPSRMARVASAEHLSRFMIASPMTTIGGGFEDPAAQKDWRNLRDFRTRRNTC